MVAKSSSFFAPTQQESGIKSQRALAAALMKQGEQHDPSAAVSGIVAKQSSLGQLARALTQGVGGYVSGQADRSEDELNTARAQKLGAAINKYSTDPMGASTDLVSDPNTADVGLTLATNKMNADAATQKQSADFDRQLALAQFKSDHAGAGQVPATIQIVDAIDKARKEGNTQRVNDLSLFAKVYDKGLGGDGQGGVKPIDGYAPTIADLESKKSGAKEQAQKDVDLNMNPQIEAATETAKTTAANKIADTKTLPVIENLSKLNADTFNIPYVGRAQPVARLIPGMNKQTTALDRMKQERLAAAAPLAKALGTNPTDSDFQNTLDQIFDMDSTKEARQAQIDALATKIKARQGGVQAPSIQEGTTATDSQGNVLVSRGGKWVKP